MWVLSLFRFGPVCIRWPAHADLPAAFHYWYRVGSLDIKEATGSRPSELARSLKLQAEFPAWRLLRLHRRRNIRVERIVA